MKNLNNDNLDSGEMAEPSHLGLDCLGRKVKTTVSNKLLCTQ